MNKVGLEPSSFAAGGFGRWYYRAALRLPDSIGQLPVYACEHRHEDVSSALACAEAERNMSELSAEWNYYSQVILQQ